jgi:hypothetical protein
MLFRKQTLIHRLRNVPLFPVIPVLPIALVVSDAVFAILNFRRLKRLETKVARPSLSGARRVRNGKVARAVA